MYNYTTIECKSHVQKLFWSQKQTKHYYQLWMHWHAYTCRSLSHSVYICNCDRQEEQWKKHPQREWQIALMYRICSPFLCIYFEITFGLSYYFYYWKCRTKMASLDLPFVGPFNSYGLPLLGSLFFFFLFFYFRQSFSCLTRFVCHAS